jgi:hypothetical protein
MYQNECQFYFAFHWLDLCYTVPMSADQDIWQVWARTLQRWGVTERVAVLLETAGPLTILGAQIVYVSQPFIGWVMPDDHMDALSRLLEDSAQTQEFVNFLREATAGEPI